MWDGLAQGDTGLTAVPGVAGWSLNLPAVGKGLGGAQPAPMAVPAPTYAFADTSVGAPAELEARLNK